VNRGSKVRSWTLLVIVNLGWAAQYPAYRVAADSVGVASLNFWTFAIAALFLLPSLANRRRIKSAPNKAFGIGDVGSFTLLAALGLIPPSVIIAWGIEHSSASNASILSLTIPVLMTLMGIFMLGERPDRTVIVSLVCACIGTALISWTDILTGKFTGDTLMGNVAVFLSGAGSAFYNAYCKKLLQRYTGAEILIYGYVAAALLCAGVSFFFDASPFYAITTWNWSVWFAIGILGAVVWGLAMLIWMHVLDDLELAQVSVSIYMLPVFGVGLSAITLGERIRTVQVVGAGIVMVSAFLSSGRREEM
jgi:drug/metabolite transporter (DMT)-like permease